MMSRCCRTIAACLLLLWGSAQADAGSRRTLLVRLDAVNRERLVGSGVITPADDAPGGIISLVRDTAFAIVSPAECTLLRERGFQCTVILEDTSEVVLVRRAAYGPSLRLQKPYHSYAAIRREMDSLQRRYPSMVRMVSVGRTTGSDQEIFALKVASQVQQEDDRPAILLDGCHHSNEVLGAEICLAAAEELTSQYGKDPDITRWVDRWQIYIIPVVNVDGHDVVSSGRDPRWRKNTRSPEEGRGAIYPEGVDLNRNYDFNWAHGGSGDPASERYRGAFPFSESETRAFARFTREHHFLLSLTYHSAGEVIYYPWTWNGHLAPDEAILARIAKGLAGSIRTMKGDSTYRAEHGAGLVGQTYPWLYGTLGTFDFVIETGQGASVFPPYEVDGIVRSNMGGVRYMLGYVDGPGLVVHVKDASTGDPIEAEVRFPAIQTEEIKPRTSDGRFGTFRRLLLPGTYEIHITRPGYAPAVVKGIEIKETGWIEREIRLQRQGM
jgi:carboxypeptidase T